MDYVIRAENLDDPAELRAVERLTYDAFTTMERPDGGPVDEHYLAHLLRGAASFVPQLDLVAFAGEELVGNILYSEAQVENETGVRHTVLTFGPLSVAPAWQKHGVGGALVRASLEKAAALGYAGVVIFGHPAYYPRFGITTADGQNFDAFMACELAPGALKGIAGRLHIDPVYVMDPAGREAFDRVFFGQNA